ncbi:MAG: hypothetical protein WD851_11235 [Pirellulales bacterium]
MKAKFRPGIAILLAASLLGATNVHADDLLPPPWRGQPLTTLTEWEFASAANPTPPDGTIPSVIGDGGGGGPLASIFGLVQWDPFDGDGAWIGTGTPTTLPGQIILDLPNWIDTEPLKLIQIQMTVQRYIRQNTDGTTELITPHVASIDAFDPTGPTSSMLLQVLPELIVDPLNGTFLRTELWKIQPNPDYERIVLNVPVDTLIDQLVIDTISRVPEPAAVIQVAIVVMGIAAATCLRRRV